jgi:hypothetical protein
MDHESNARRSRRSMLAALVGGTVAAAAASLGRPQAVSAQANPVVLGGYNTATTITQITNTAAGVYAFKVVGTGSGRGIEGHSDSEIGVAGYSSSGTGAFGTSETGVGVYGSSDSTTKPAMTGWSFGNTTGVVGYAGPNAFPAFQPKTGVYGYADKDATSAGVRGSSPAGRGGIFKGGAAALRLAPSTAATHPASGQKGDLFVDSHGRLWFCKGSTSWKQLA